MLQLIRQVFKDPEDKTQLSLLFANQVSVQVSTAARRAGCPGSYTHTHTRTHTHTHTQRRYTQRVGAYCFGGCKVQPCHDVVTVVVTALLS